MAKPSNDTSAARRRMRAARSALAPSARRDAEESIRLSIRNLGLLRPGDKLAVYLAMPGEVDLTGLVEDALRLGVDLYAPRIASRRRREIVFVPYDGRSGSNPRGYAGVAEPLTATARRIPVRRLDTMLLPLVGFDRAGNRLGMGAGFYDRALRMLRDRSCRWRRPRLVGVAFACQELPAIDASSWDVPLDLVVTDREVIRPERPKPRGAQSST
ncbi:MAG TPA: 5-formyltetrahydrofolate cyclo-ligase [Steroidobacteraceae bacterium]|nr:5-formyltetrahydrofolate cyclo-ligase [Steroidobacteraceae bacterium]